MERPRWSNSKASSLSKNPLLLADIKHEHLDALRIYCSNLNPNYLPSSAIRCARGNRADFLDGQFSQPLLGQA